MCGITTFVSVKAEAVGNGTRPPVYANNYKPAYASGFDVLETELTLYKRFNKPQT